MALLSVIVPVYKVEEYLPQCVESILAQRFLDLEVILVDDGSPDSCGELCDGFAARHPNVRVLHKANGGLPEARRAGLRLAEGKYFTFVDSDDWIDPEMYGGMIAQAEEHGADIVAAGFLQDDGVNPVPYANTVPSGVYRGERLAELRGKAVFDPEQMRSGVAPSVWSKIFRSEFARESFLNEKNMQNFGEDAIFVYPLLEKAECVVVDNANCCYHYRLRGTSIINAYRPGYFRELYALHDQLTAHLGTSAALAYNYAYLYANGLNRLMARSNGVGYGEKYRLLRELVTDGRLAACLEQIEPERLPKPMAAQLRLLAQGKPGSFMASYLASAVRSRINR